MTNQLDGPASALIDEAVKKAAVAWVSVADRQADALWCVPLESSLYVVSGPGEQSAPGLADASGAVVTLRGDHGGRIVTFRATVVRIRPGDAEWDRVASLVAAKRLNAPGGPAELVDRWAAECVLNRLTPAAPPLAAADTLPADSLAAPLRRISRRTGAP